MSNDKLVKGFNDAWLLKKYQPELATKLYKGFQDKSFDYAVGFKNGMDMEQPEKSKKTKQSKSKKFEHRNIDHSRFKTSSISKSKEKDKDMGDRDK